jgi:rhodanese-related sulfurtransferase
VEEEREGVGKMARKITRDELKRMMESNEGFKLVDVLSKESYGNEHIKGALSVPLDDIEEKAAGLLNREDKIVVYCASFDCQASTKAAEKLLSMGFKNTVDYKGGLMDYKEAGLPLEGKLHEASTSVASSCSCC